MKEGIVPEFILWNPVELGYLTVWTAKYLLDGNSLPKMNLSKYLEYLQNLYIILKAKN